MNEDIKKDGTISNKNVDIYLDFIFLPKLPLLVKCVFGCVLRRQYVNLLITNMSHLLNSSEYENLVIVAENKDV
jgi:hypothetical protein